MEEQLNINNMFIPYELALKLKELGFKEECLASYYHTGRKLYIYEYINRSEYTTLAPLWQQAARFLNNISDNQIKITIDGKDDYEGLCKKFEKAIKYFWNI